MPNLVTDDDELELEDEQKRRAAQQGTIGQMPRPNPSTSSVPPAMAPPDVGAASQTPPTISGAAPFKTSNPEVAAPRPAQQAYQDWESQDLAKHPVGKPRYNLAGTIGDTIAGATGLEKYGEFGTTGAEAKRERLAKAAATEEEQIKGGEQERQANATAEETGARAQETAAGAQPETINTPGGPVQVLTKNAGPPAAAIIAGQSRENVAGTNAGAREAVANTNAGAREETAKIMVGGKALGTKEIQGADGKAHVMMWNPTTHSYDKDLGEAPPKQAASSSYANTRTVQLLDPESGIPTVYQYNAQTNSYDKPVGTSATGAYGHEMAQAGAVERSGGQLINDIKSHAQDLGTLSAWVQKYGLNTPIADPELAKLQSELSTFAALQPAMHGFRARSAMEAFENIIGGLQQNPEATIASIQGILQTAGNINPTRKGSTSSQGAPGGGASAPSSGKVIKYDSQGNRIQ